MSDTRSRFLAAYACSGLAGLIYEVTWTRLLTLRLGHTTAAASTVLAAFMGGLAIGAFLAGRFAHRLTPRRALTTYAALEAIVIACALTMSWQLELLTPALRWAYQDGAGAWFMLVRLASSGLVLVIPAMALGATFPLAVRACDQGDGWSAGLLYAVNTAGATVGALLAGFVLIPGVGVFGATLIAAAGSGASIALALTGSPAREVGRQAGIDPRPEIPRAEIPAKRAAAPRKGRVRGTPVVPPPIAMASPIIPWSVVALTGFATFVFEIGWTRSFAMILGPSTYAFSAVVAICIGGLAIGSATGAWISGRAPDPGAPLAMVLAVVAVIAAWTTAFAGGSVPRIVAADLAGKTASFETLLASGLVWMTVVVLPVTLGLGIAFPLSLRAAMAARSQAAETTSTIYAISTTAGVAGALVAGFILLPRLGLQDMLRLAGGLLAAAALAACLLPIGRMVRLAGLVIVMASVVALVLSPPWDRALLAGGGYKYARYVPQGTDLARALGAGRFIYYRDGASATVSVKELAGVRSMAIDGKIDASNGSDMLTQKLLAHLPLLLHPAPQRAAIIGLGSGVTLGAALVHPLTEVDVIEISPEVVDASRWFAEENRHALDDPRARVLVADGRSHLLLSSAKYDAIISEPSNPWMAGVASLFTREFFESAKARLTPGGVLCQWAHTYDISAHDLKSIVATFASVFPEGTMWLVGEGDLLLVGSDAPLDEHLDRIARQWNRAGVAEDLASVGAFEPFALLSSYVGGPGALASYGSGAEIQRDGRMALEFSGPRSVNRESGDITTSLVQLQAIGRRNPDVQRAMVGAPAALWRNRGEMMLRAHAFDTAYDDYARALALDPSDVPAAVGLVKAAAGDSDLERADMLLADAIRAQPEAAAPRIALSRLRASTGQVASAVTLVAAACHAPVAVAEACEQLASIYLDAGDTAALAPVAEGMMSRWPDHPATLYVMAGLGFLEGELARADAFADRAVAADRNRAPAWNLVGAIRATEGNLPAARAAFRKAMALDPRDGNTYMNFARLELSSGNRSEAAQLFEDALSLDPTSVPAREGLAQANSHGFEK